jgi:hypothetical protein
VTDLRWAVAAAYAAGAALAYLASRTSPVRERRFWLTAGALLLMMGVAKQLQLQDDITALARTVLRAAGWYDRHEEAQKLFAAILAIALLGVSALLGSWLRGSTPSVKTAAGVLWLLVAFVLVRAASFHAMDEWVIRERLGLRLGWWIELAGIAAIGACALVSLGARKRSF